VSDAPPRSAELRARVLAAARAESVVPRSIWLRRGAMALAAGAAVSLVTLVAIGGPSADGRPIAYYEAIVALWAAIGVVATWAGVSRGHSMLGRPAPWRVSVAVLTPVALVATALLAGAAWPSTFQGESGFHHHVVCIVCTLVMAAGPLVAFVLMRRGSDPVAPRLTGAALGATAGAWGATCIELRCGLATVDHVILGHVLPVVVLAVAGIAVGARWIAVRGAR
jgi:hypothetical protein